MFNPKEQLAEARRQQPALDEAYKKAEKAVEDYTKPLVEFFARLETDIDTMPIAQRFRRDRNPDLSLHTTGIANPMLSDLNEADHKRAQLKVDLAHVRSLAINLSGLVEGLVLDMEATKID